MRAFLRVEFDGAVGRFRRSRVMLGGIEGCSMLGGFEPVFGIDLTGRAVEFGGVLDARRVLGGSSPAACGSSWSRSRVMLGRCWPVGAAGRCFGEAEGEGSDAGCW